MKKKNQNGITLIALVVTIVVLLILAGVSISVVLGDNGLIENAREAKRQTESKSAQELNDIEKLEADIAKQSGAFNNEKGVNEPNLKNGMTPIYFELGSDDIYEEKVTTQDADNWYNYKEKKWANAQTKDGSMWVWIPRFAYKINDDNKTFDVKFLMGTTDYYLDENNIPQKAVRGTADSSPDTRKEYTVHPAFTDETGIGFKNGGWDSELTGIWVAKFEAGFADIGEQVESTVKYTQSTCLINGKETESGNDVWTDARNIYGKYDTNTNMTYPVFQGLKISYNYITLSDAYTLCKSIVKTNNIYGLEEDANSHLIKNSEWGAVSYLGQSQYGLNGTNIYVNNVNINSSTKSGYAVTGVCGTDEGNNTYDVNSNPTITLDNIKKRNANNVKSWNINDGTKSSSSGTIYGIYDFSGGVAERVAAYIDNGNQNLYYGESFTSNEIKRSTQYYTIYKYKEPEDSGGNSGIENKKYNINLKEKIYGDAILETSEIAEINETNFFFGDYAAFPSLYNPFFNRGGKWREGIYSGLFSYLRNDGTANYDSGFRAVLV
mgnify:CR=1 FL=1